MAALARYPWRPLGELLVEKGLLRSDELEDALAEQRRSGRKLGEVLVERRLISGEQLTCVLAEQYGVHLEVHAGASDSGSHYARSQAEAPRPLGRLLLDRGILAEEELDFALELQRSTGRRLGEILVEQGSLSWTTVAAVVAEQHGVARVDVTALRAVPVAAPGATPPTPAAADAPVYEVRERRAPLYRSESFLEAADFAFEQLDRNPAELTIVRLGATVEEVWRYSADLADARD